MNDEETILEETILEETILEETIFRPRSVTFGRIVLSDSLRQETQASTIGVMNPLAASTEEQMKISFAPVLIGRDPKSADFLLSDDSVSRQHAKITPTKTGFIIEDLDSSNGTYVDGVPIVSCVLHGGDSVQIGKNLFLFDHVLEYAKRT